MIPLGRNRGQASSTMIGTPLEHGTGKPSCDRVCHWNSTCPVNWLAIRKGSMAEENASRVNCGSNTKLISSGLSAVSPAPARSATWAEPFDRYRCDVLICPHCRTT